MLLGLFLPALIVGFASQSPTLTVPAGFTVASATTPGLVKYPVHGCFDDRGRLYVTEVVGPLVQSEVMKQKPLHRIVRLEDTDGDNVFDRSTVFADGIPLPQGCLVFQGSVYVACPPGILKFTDTNGDGITDKREVWFDGKTITGCANDLHGPVVGPDGYLYWTKGAFAEQTHKLGNGEPWKSKAAHVYRAKPDGSGLEVMLTGGMDSPVGVAFAPNGEPIVSNTFLQHPAEGKRDGLIHAVRGGVWGKEHDPVHGYAWTGPALMPVLTHLGPAAPSGMVTYRATRFGDDFAFDLFCTQFNLRKVSRHKLVPDGSTYRTEDGDFVACDDPDFHPTDAIVAPDGSLLVIDTGGWYKLCCPSSQLVKIEAFGGIHRVDAVKPKANRVPPTPTVPPLHARRRAIAALGQAKEKSAVPRLLIEAADATNDRFLDHAVTYALIEIGDYAATAEGLSHASPRVVRSALAVLQAIDAGKLRPEQVLPHLDATDVALRETAWWVAGKHPAWGERLAGVFRAALAKPSTPEQSDELVKRLTNFASAAEVQRLLAEQIAHPLVPKVMAAQRGSPPSVWVTAVADRLTTAPSLPLLAVVQAWNLKTPAPELKAALTTTAGEVALPTSVRLAAMTLGIGELKPEAAEFAFRHLTGDDAGLRNASAEVLLKRPLTTIQLVNLIARLNDLPPSERVKLLAPFATSTNEAVGRGLLTALGDPSWKALVRSDQVKPILVKFPAAIRTAAEPLYRILDAEIAQQRDRLETLLASLPTGDRGRGQKVFHSAKAACATCHNIGYVGGRTGPDLTRIGATRTDRDLLEAIVYPSLSFVRSYEPFTVTTLAGKQFSGILKSESPTELTLTIAADKIERIARADIDEIKPGTVSIMPAGLDQQMTPQEIADLLAFLKGCR